MDPRLADRRREVAESRAQRNLRRLIKYLLVASFLGATVWLFLSPILSVERVEVRGADSSPVTEILQRENVVVGRPMILIRDSPVEEALLSDPWIKEADIHVDWPNDVLVQVLERTPVAIVETRDSRTQRAVDGTTLPTEGELSSILPTIVLPDVADITATDSQDLLGALEFVDVLPVSLGSNATVTLKDGELWATVAGFEVRLGRPTEMEDKALTLTALLRTEIEPGSVLNLIAPTNPSLIPPVSPDDADDTGDSEESSGNSGDTAEP